MFMLAWLLIACTDYERSSVVIDTPVCVEVLAWQIIEKPEACVKRHMSLRFLLSEILFLMQSVQQVIRMICLAV